MVPTVLLPMLRTLLTCCCQPRCEASANHFANLAANCSQPGNDDSPRHAGQLPYVHGKREMMMQRTAWKPVCRQTPSPNEIVAEKTGRNRGGK
jgi:hypothetical protein